MRRKNERKIRFPKQRAEELTRDYFFQEEIKKLRKKWCIPDGGIKSNEESEKWHRKLSIISDTYLDSKEFTQAKETLNIVDERINLDDIDSVCKEIMDDLQEITVEKKQKYMRSMIKSIYVKERSEALVNGYLPLYTQAQNIHYEPISRDCGVA